MMPVHPIPPNPFAGHPLDRMDARRKNDNWVADVLADPTTVFLPIWRTKNLISTDTPNLATLDPEHARAQLNRIPWAVLGQQDGRVHVALDVSSFDIPLPDGATAGFSDLRRVAAALPANDAALLAYARGLMHWRTRNRFCGVCGAACLPQSAGHVLACTGCGAHHFPRTDPAVIMLVTHNGRALLGQPARFREFRIMTTLAGFVEPGESLEEAVAREVHEEAGVHVGNVRYHSSQPWPFPASIMLGFTAEADHDALTIDPDELVTAGWFTPAQVRAQDGFVLPPPMSIARRLIEDWLIEHDI